MRVMSTILVRCSVHPEVSHEAFCEWLERRRTQLTEDAGAIRGVVARRLGERELLLEVHCEPDLRDDDGLGTAMRHFAADLTLLGMRPAVYEAVRPDRAVR
jgi:hypothetical protein